MGHSSPLYLRPISTKESILFAFWLPTTAQKRSNNHVHNWMYPKTHLTREFCYANAISVMQIYSRTFPLHMRQSIKFSNKKGVFGKQRDRKTAECIRLFSSTKRRFFYGALNDLTIDNNNPFGLYFLQHCAVYLDWLCQKSRNCEPLHSVCQEVY